MSISQWFSSKIFEQEIILLRKSLLVISGLFIFRIFLNVLDLLGVALIAYLAGAVTSGSYPSLPVNPMNLMPSGAITQEGVVILGAVATLSFFLKAALAMTVVYFSTRYSAYLEARYSANVLESLFERDKLAHNRSDPEHYQLMFTRGSRGRIAGLLSAKLDLVGEGSLFLILSLVMLIVSPTIGLSVIAFLVLSLLVLVRLILKNVKRQQEIVQHTDRESLLTIRNFSSILTELRLSRNSAKKYWSEKFFDVRYESGIAFSNLRILQAAPRYALEILALLGLFLLISLVILFSSVSELGAQIGFAVGALFRIGTSLIPIQSALQYLQVSRTDSKLSEHGADLSKSPTSMWEDQFPKAEASGLFSIPQATEIILPNSKPLIFRDSLSVNPKEWVSIVGPSGIGKSSMLSEILSYVQRKPIQDISIGYCPQSPALIPGSMVENVLLESPSDPRRTAAAVELAESLGLKEEDFNQTSLNEGQSQISGGQLLRVGIARALLLQPSALILDEPTSALDEQTSNTVLDWLRENYSGALLVATHDSEVVRRSDRIFEIEELDNRLMIYSRVR